MIKKDLMYWSTSWAYSPKLLDMLEAVNSGTCLIWANCSHFYLKVLLLWNVIHLFALNLKVDLRKQWRLTNMYLLHTWKPPGHINTQVKLLICLSYAPSTSNSSSLTQSGGSVLQAHRETIKILPLTGSINIQSVFIWAQMWDMPLLW